GVNTAMVYVDPAAPGLVEAADNASASEIIELSAVTAAKFSAESAAAASPLGAGSCDSGRASLDGESVNVKLDLRVPPVPGPEGNPDDKTLRFLDICGA